MTIGMLAADVLAQDPAGPEFGKASPVGLALIVVLLVATALLIRNMNKRIGKLPETFRPEHPEPDQAADEGTDRGAATAPEIEGTEKTEKKGSESK
ncbi:hypothetical protein I0Q12_29265 [Rhodococcus sp. CX]|uniref:hypothetical protein n=1 Tax=Rhodococcus sp. CX TaxID=2789880 RepID=UPI0018CEB48F|nr:hypothetical protein [Rhodococcus sp. CX]MBH0123359.1 hypothetical protein [Rhodococcus sp. CX]